MGIEREDAIFGIETEEIRTIRRGQEILHEGAETLGEVKEFLECAKELAAGTGHGDRVKTWDELEPAGKLKAILTLGGGEESDPIARERVKGILTTATREDRELEKYCSCVALAVALGNTSSSTRGYDYGGLPEDPLEEIRRAEIEDEWHEPSRGGRRYRIGREGSRGGGHFEQQTDIEPHGP